MTEAARRIDTRFRRNREADGPLALARRMAGYCKDAAYIQAMVRRDFGSRHLPTIETIRELQAAEARRNAPYAIGKCDYNPDNDNGEDWRPVSLVKPAKVPRIHPVAPKAKPAFDPAPHRQILNIVADHFEVSVRELLSKNRRRNIVIARCVAAHALRHQRWKHSGKQRYSLPQIAKILGYNDHTSVIYLLDVFGAYRRKYPEVHAASLLAKRKLRNAA